MTQNSKKAIQPLRRSQFILTYGPGSIIETKFGPRLIPIPSIGMNSDRNPNWTLILNKEKNIIEDARVCDYIKKAKKTEGCVNDEDIVIFSLPTSNESGKKNAIYDTKIFPQWRICNNKDGHHKKGFKSCSILHQKYDYCPVCGKSVNENHSTIRFIAACPNGHMDDIRWNYVVHYKSNSNCKSKFFYWKPRGSSLKSIKIECPECHTETTMEDVSWIFRNHKYHCSGRSPEKEELFGGDKYTKDCDADVRIVQRQSSSLYLPNTVTLVTIPEYSDNISRILQDRSIKRSVNSLLNLWNINNNALSNEGLCSIVNSIQDLNSNKKQELINFITYEGADKFLLKLNPPVNENLFDYITDEFKTLLKGEGQVPDDLFKMGKFIEWNVDGSPVVDHLRFCPVERIRTVTVQTGYVRMIGNAETVPHKNVDIGESDLNINARYYPGFEGFGEGLFIHCPEKTLKKINKSTSYDAWLKCGESVKKNNFKKEWDDVCTIPEFVWIHTLSHLFMRSISEFTGYSLSSIKERVYYDTKTKEGGILLYNTAPGEDGTLGGLVDIINIIDKIMDKVNELALYCSNDPLCSDARQDGNKVNGAACYGCLFISETACEHGNKWLDRNLLIE